MSQGDFFFVIVKYRTLDFIVFWHFNGYDLHVIVMDLDDCFRKLGPW
jgi:hypothetical protein